MNGGAHAYPRRLAVLCDPPGEEWPSMTLAGEMLTRELRAIGCPTVEVSPGLPRLLRRLPGFPPRAAFNADRALTRFALYPLRAAALRTRADCFHVVDHTYAQLVRVLPKGRAGVYCHDLDAFTCLLDPAREPRPRWFRALARATLLGLQRAALVFHSTEAVRAQLLAHGLVEPPRLVHAPLGVAPEFFSPPAQPPPALAPLAGRRFVLHVGSAAPRKRLDLVFAAFAQAAAGAPELLLVQQGATLGEAERGQVERLGLTPRLVQPPHLDRAALAWLYRNAAVVLLPSDREGFGLPVIEALAAGAGVIASDLPALREVGGDAVCFCPPGDVHAFGEALARSLASPEALPSAEMRRTRAARFSWATHARILAGAYATLGGGG